MKHRLFFGFPALLGFSLLTATATAQQPVPYSAQACVDYALKNSFQVKNALLGIKIQEQTNREYTAAALPRIGGSLGSNYAPSIATQVFPNFIALATYGVLEKEGVKDGSGNSITTPKDVGFINAQFGTRYTASVGMDFSQLLFDGQVFIALQARKSALQLSEKNREVTEVNIKANILKIYYQLVAGKKQLDVLDANTDRIQKLLLDTRELFKNGFAEKLDIDKLNVTLMNLQTEKEKVNRQLESGYLGLKLLMGMPMTEAIRLTDTLPEKQLKMDMLEEAYDYNSRKEFQQLGIARKLGDFNIRRYQLSKVPTLAMFGQYYTNAQRNVFNFFDFNQPWFPASIIGVKMSVSFFEGLGRNARISRARYELQQTVNNMELLKLSIDQEVEQSRLRFRNAIVSMDNQSRNMELAEKVYNLTKVKYEQGLSSNLEITNAQTELRIAQTNYFNALYEAILARVDYDKATGKL